MTRAGPRSTRGRELRSSDAPPSSTQAATARPGTAPDIDGWTREVTSYFSDASEYWDHVYSSKTAKAQVYRNRMAVALRWATRIAGPGAVAADVGCGAGHLAVALAERGVRITAIDASEAMVAVVAKNASRAGVADLVHPMTSQAQDLEMASETCDLVSAIGLLSWVKPPEVALREMTRITKPGGYVIVTMDNALSVARGIDPGWHESLRRLIRRVRRFVKRQSVESPAIQWPSPMTRRDFERLVRAAGLELVDVTGVGFGPFTFLGRTIVPESVGLFVDRMFQGFADRQVPLLQHVAIFHVALARKPAQPVTPCLGTAPDVRSR
jgi:ubiquinone/menaquinone biosynthesis C-methylase UbiE